MITKSKFWKLIREEMKNSQRSKEITQVIMEKIKDIPQHETKNS